MTEPIIDPEGLGATERQTRFGGNIRLGSPLNPSEDPSLIALQRRQGASAGRARAEIQKRQDALNLGRDRYFEDRAIQEERGMERVNEGFESRGLFRSSAADLSRGRLAGDVQRQRDRFQQDFDLNMADLEERRSRIGAGHAEQYAKALFEARRRHALREADQELVTQFE